MNKKNYSRIKIKSRFDWKKKRKIGGSDLAVIVGEGKRQTKKDIWKRICFGIEKERNNPRMIEGAKEEKHILALIAIEHPEWKIQKPPVKNWLFVRKDNPYMTLSPDALFNSKKSAIEIKDICIYRQQQLMDYENGIIPKQYYYQIIQYFIVINTLQDLYFYVRIKIMKGKEIDYVKELCYHFNRNDFLEEIERCYQIEKSFIEEYIIPQIEPSD